MSFARCLELRPARIGFNLELADARNEEPERVRVWAGKSGLRRFRGRVVCEEGGDVWVQVGEIPSGRVIRALLPRAWFEQAQIRPVPDLPVLLATWRGGRHIWDERLRPVPS